MSHPPRPKLVLVPVSLREANEFVLNHHRHNRPTSRNGGKWACGCGTSDRGLVGVAIVGRPIAASLDDGWTAEVLRVCTLPDAPRNACSMLYGAAWRAWRAMGGRRMVTYTLDSESGASLRGAGWRIVAEVKPGDWHRPNIGRFRNWQPIYGQQKFRW
ncbi:MAG: XF1762 family protein [Verrucomicrobiia bacterium]